MSNTTPNFNLFKYDTVADSESAFSINRALNNNWDLLDANCVKRGSTSAATGSATRPVYVDAKGQIQACSKDLVNDNYLTATVLLDENGYIKFSNNLLVIWGTSSNFSGLRKFELAITYTKYYNILITPISSHGGFVPTSFEQGNLNGYKTLSSFCIGMSSYGTGSFAGVYWSTFGV